jgi:hypothetical protein
MEDTKFIEFKSASRSDNTVANTPFVVTEKQTSAETGKSKPKTICSSYTFSIDENYHGHAVLCDYNPTEEEIKLLQPSNVNTDIPDSYDMTSKLRIKLNNVLILIIVYYIKQNDIRDMNMNVIQRKQTLSYL